MDERETEVKSSNEADKLRTTPEGSESVPVVVEEGCENISSACDNNEEFCCPVTKPTQSTSVRNVVRKRTVGLKKGASMESRSASNVCCLREDPNSMQNVDISRSVPNLYRSPLTGFSPIQPVLRNAEKRTPTRIAVSGIPYCEKNGDRLRQYFSSPLSGGGQDVQNAYWTRHKSDFVIEFISTDTVARILARQHKLCSCQLDVRALEPTLDDAQPLSRAFWFRHGGVEEVSRLHNYLDHLNIKSRWHHDTASNRIVVSVPSLQDLMKVFKLDNDDDDIEDVQKVVQFEGEDITLVPLFPVDCSTWVEGDIEGNVVYATHLSRDHTEDDLVTYFTEGIRHQRISNVLLSTTDRPRALVEFDCSVDFHQLRRWVYEQPLKGRMIGVERVPVTSRIRVSNLDIEDSESDDQTREDLTIHFSCIAGTEVYDVELKPAQRCAIINFHNRKVLEDVLQHPKCSTNKLFKSPLQIELDFDV